MVNAIYFFGLLNRLLIIPICIVSLIRFLHIQQLINLQLRISSFFLCLFIRATSCYTYLLNINGDSTTKLSILTDSFIELHPLHQTTLYSALPYLHERLQYSFLFIYYLLAWVHVS